MKNFKILAFLLSIFIYLSGCSSINNSESGSTFAAIKNLKVSDFVGGSQGYFRDRGKDYHSSWLIAPLELPEELEPNERSVKYSLPNAIPDKMPEVNLEPLDVAKFTQEEEASEPA